MSTLSLQGDSPRSAPDTATPPTSAPDDFWTPIEIRECLIDLIDLDPCSAIHKPIDAQVHYMLDRGQDGLVLPWGRNPSRREDDLQLALPLPMRPSVLDGKTHVWLNPPYSRGSLPAWTAKAKAEFVAGNCSLILGTIPARTSAKYFWDNVWDTAWVGHPEGRLIFEYGPKNKPMDGTGKFDSVFLAYVDAKNDRAADAFERFKARLEDVRRCKWVR